MDFFTIPQANGILAVNEIFASNDLLSSFSGSHVLSIGLVVLPTENDMDIQNTGLPFPPPKITMDILNIDLPFSPLQNLILSNTPFSKPQK